MASLLAHKLTHPTNCRILPKKLIHLNSFLGWPCVHLIMSRQKSPKVHFQCQKSVQSGFFLLKLGGANTNVEDKSIFFA